MASEVGSIQDGCGVPQSQHGFDSADPDLLVGITQERLNDASSFRQGQTAKAGEGYTADTRVVVAQ